MELWIGKIFLLVYIIISSNMLINVVNRSIIKEIENNKMLQHMILIILVMSIIIITGSDKGYRVSGNYIINMLTITLMVYIWFIMLMKLDIGYQLSIVLILMIYIIYITNNERKLEMTIRDENIDIEKKIIINKMNNIIENYGLLIIFGLTAIGTVLYDSEKQVQYGGGYNLTKFLFN
jgi:hypothetical protein